MDKETDFKYCTYCGIKNKAEAIFCYMCGNKTD